MLQNLLVAAVLVSIGCCIWVRRHSWRFRWDRVLTLGVLFQGAGFALTMPANGRYTGRILFALTGVAHLRDYLGHLCFMSAAGAMVSVVASRLLPDEHLERFMRRVEIPAAVAAAAMLSCILLSPVLRRPAETGDFFQAHRDNWLVAYWLIYMAICAYLLRCLVDLLFVLRQDDRNRIAAGLYIAACRIGFVAILLVVVDVTSSGSRIHSIWIWSALCIASGLSIATGAWSWRNRNHISRLT